MIDTISLQRLLLILIPIILVGLIEIKWNIKIKNLVVATIRMISQLLLVGYVLKYIFSENTPVFNLLLVLFMTLMASIISVRTSPQKSRHLYLSAFFSICVG